MFKQWPEIIPLEDRGILEFIEHDVIDIASGFFIDKRCGIIADQSFKEPGGIRQEELVFFISNIQYPQGCIIEDAQ